MVQPIPPGGNTPQGTPSPTENDPSQKKVTSVYGASTAQPMTFLGMHFTADEAKKLWYAIMQQISTSIQSEQARTLKALRKLRKSETE